LELSNAKAIRSVVTLGTTVQGKPAFFGWVVAALNHLYDAKMACPLRKLVAH